MDSFQQAVDETINQVNKRKNTIPMRLDFIKQLYGLLLSSEGRKFITEQEEFRNMLEIKTNEFINDTSVEHDSDFISVLIEMLTVLGNINTGKM